MAEDTGRDEDADAEIEDDDDNATDAASGAEVDPAELRVELERLKRANTRLRRENQKRREAASKQASNRSGDDDAVKQAVAEAVAPIRVGAITSAARLAFRAAGVHDDDPDRLATKLGKLVKMLDHDAIEFENGAVVGLEDQVEELKDLYPEFFETKKQSPGGKRAPKLDGSNKAGGAGGTPKTSAQLLAERLGAK